VKNIWNASTNRRTAKRGTTSKSGWTENVYLDLDVILAELNADDWLASDVDIDATEGAKMSVATGIELQYVMEDEWDRDRVAGRIKGSLVKTSSYSSLCKSSHT